MTDKGNWANFYSRLFLPDFYQSSLVRDIQLKIYFQIIFSFILLIFSNSAVSQQLAFPTAEGYGKQATGGRGGRVFIVKNLNASGPGSLAEAVNSAEPRTILFAVSGTIEGNIDIRHGDVTIAGQTAPGDGICIKGSLRINADNVILRYFRVRANPSVGEVDAISGRGHKNIILDHLSASWSSDEILSLYQNENVTIQWCLIAEACAKFLEGKNTGHRFGGIWGNNQSTYHHNLFAHNDSRNPRWSSGAKFNDYRNNVVFNWGYNSCYGGGAADSRRTELDSSTFNMIANYYKPGPATRDKVKRRIAEPGTDNEGGVGSWFVAENVVEGFPDVSKDNWKGIDGDKFKKLQKPWDSMAIKMTSAEKAYEKVLETVGCSLPKRDSIDARIIQEVKTGKTSFGTNGIITSPTDVGGWPKLRSESAPRDTDKDGIPDEWETAHGLNPNDPADSRKARKSDGYSNLEAYLNETSG